VHLADRGGCDWLFVELQKEPLQRLIEILLDNSANLFEGEGPDIVL